MASNNLDSLRNLSQEEIERLADEEEQKQCSREIKKSLRRQFQEREANPHRNTHNQTGNKKVKGL